MKVTPFTKICIDAARTAWSPSLEEHEPRIWGHLVPTTGRESDLITAYLRDPGNLAKAVLNRAWKNVAEGMAWFLAFEAVRDRAVSANLACYVSCGFLGLFVLGAEAGWGEDAAAVAMIAGAYAADLSGNRSMVKAMSHVLQSWPGIFCCAERNALPRLLANALNASPVAKHAGPEREAVGYAVRRSLRKFDGMRRTERQLIAEWLLIS